MNYEERYNQALEIAKHYHDRDNIHFLEHIFPELRETEDERIRKEIIQSIQDNMCVIHKDKCLAWLEKQKEIETEDFGEFINELSKQFPEVSFAKLSRIAVRIKNWLEKQGEQGIIDLKEYAKGILKGAATHLMIWIDENLADGNMCLSNMECEDLEDAMVNAKWDKIYNYIKKKVEKQDEHKPSWSEEDEYQINTILHGLDLKRELYKKEGNKVEEERYKTQYDWLKSIKHKKHWKPSEEQMEALKNRTHGLHTSSETRKILESLINDLEKL